MLESPKMVFISSKYIHSNGKFTIVSYILKASLGKKEQKTKAKMKYP